MISQYSNFQAIARNPAATLKTYLLRDFSSDPIFLEVLRLAYDATITFGVTMGHRDGAYVLGSTPLRDGGEAPPWEALNAVLRRLAARELTGSAAHSALWGLLENAQFETQWVIAGILNKDLRIGIGPKTINKAIPGLVPDFSCMLAQRDIARVRFPARVEIKHNGDRNLAIVENREVIFYSRKGHTIPGHNRLRAEILATFPDGWVLDGEHMKGVWGEESHDAPMVIYDLLTLGEFRAGKCTRPFGERRSALEAAQTQGPWEMLELAGGIVANAWDDVQEFFNRVVASGGEGVVIKPLDGLYEFKRSHNWVKLKPVDTKDAPIVDYVESAVVPGTLAAIVVEYDGRRFKLGAGFTPAQRETLWNSPHRIGSIVEFKHSGLTPYGIPLCAAFIRFRDDKEVE